MNATSHDLRQYDISLSVCRLDADAEIPAWATKGAITSIVRTPHELSVLTETANVPEGQKAIGPYVPFEVVGPLDPELVGVLAGLLEPLAEKGISILTVSTYDTDWVLVPQRDADAAAGEWRRRGSSVVPAHP